MSQVVLYFLHSTSVLSFYIDDVLTLSIWQPPAGIISYPLFADADTGIYPHAASQYHARPKAKRGIAMLSNTSKELIHAQTIFVTFWNVSAALQSQLSH